MILGGKTDPSNIQMEIDRVVTIMSDLRPESDEYARINKQLKELHERKVAEMPKPLSPDTILMVTANIAGILLIVGHERAHVITSKAVGFVRTLR